MSAHFHVVFTLVQRDFPYNHRVGLKIDDTQRTANALAGIGGKRLTTKQTG